jgi:phytoene dehydrogenase-like protein
MTHPPSPTAAVLGRLGQPETPTQLAARRWDAIVVGAGHNGLTCAAYLARAGRKVLVLEARERVGGACTIQEPWPGVKFSPCAYVAGLLHQLVIDELALPARGLEWFPAAGGLFVPFEDGSSIQLWNDDAKCEAEVRRFSPNDVAGWRAMVEVKRRLRELLRPDGPRDVWIGQSPTRDEIDALLGRDEEARNLLLEWSMADYLEHFIKDERLRMAYLGQGVVGTNASPSDPGTASVYFHHASGRMFGMPGTWGYVRGGMGMISFLICDVAREAGAVIACGMPVARITPGMSVELESGERISARSIISNADPRTTLRLLGRAADDAWRAQVEAIPMTSVTVKVNMTLRELPNFKARPGTLGDHHTGQINTPLTLDQWNQGLRAARAGELPDRLWTELYLQTVYDPSVAPPGVHTLSVFSQYVPNQFATGSWESRRADVGERVVDAIGRFCSNIPQVITGLEVLGPPDIEERLGLYGGHIFHGEILPAHMWDQRLKPRTPMPGLYLCGVGTYPGGSVIAIHGRNAAREVLRDTGEKTLGRSRVVSGDR